MLESFDKNDTDVFDPDLKTFETCLKLSRFSKSIVSKVFESPCAKTPGIVVYFKTNSVQELKIFYRFSFSS